MGYRERQRERGEDIIVIIIGGKQKLCHSESAQAVPACPGEGRLEARCSVR
jgi:hypothetical protein